MENKDIQQRMTHNKKSDSDIINGFKINTGSFETIKEEFENE